MRLKSYRVTNFRSVDDSGPIEVDDVTALIGTNESGKTNLLLPLWKFKPAKDGQIVPTADYPRKRYNDFRGMEKKPQFIETVFIVPADLSVQLSTMTGFPAEMFSEITFRKHFGKGVYVEFEQVSPEREISSEEVASILGAARVEVNSASALKGEADTKPAMIVAIDKAKAFVDSLKIVDAAGFEKVKEHLSIPNAEGTPRSMIAPRFGRLKDDLEELGKTIAKPHPNQSKEATELAVSRLPSFVYYSNYGNLDSEIYLPHVIANMQRKDLGAKEEAKARTLKVLFEFVGLQANEILELGKDLKAPLPGKELTEDEIQKVSDRKKERSILLQSAGTKLTN